MFNPYLKTLTASSSSSSGGSSETVRYTVKAVEADNKTTFKLYQTINSVSSYVGDAITFDSSDISYTTTQTVEEALTDIYNTLEGNYNFTTFEELGIDTTGKTMAEVLKEVKALNLPVNTIITGQLYQPALPVSSLNNAEVEIQITKGASNQQIYWCTLTSISTSPYSWNSIYYISSNSTTAKEVMAWTPTYIQAATTENLGGIKIGNYLVATTDGTTSVDLSSLQTALDNWVSDIAFTSSSEGNEAGIAGATDIYTISFKDSTTKTFIVKNGIVPIFKVSDTAIQVSTDNGSTYSDLVLLSDLKGEKGDDGTSITISSTEKTDGITTITFSDDTSIEIEDGQNGHSPTIEIYKDVIVWRTTTSSSTAYYGDDTSVTKFDLTNIDEISIIDWWSSSESISYTVNFYDSSDNLVLSDTITSALEVGNYYETTNYSYLTITSSNANNGQIVYSSNNDDNNNGYYLKIYYYNDETDKWETIITDNLKGKDGESTDLTDLESRVAALETSLGDISTILSTVVEVSE